MPALSFRFTPNRIPDAADLARRIGMGRTALAVGILAAPGPAARLIGADAATAARVTWLSRMMAIRDAAIGVGTLNSVRRGRDAGPWVLAGGVSDLVDAVAVATAMKQGRLAGPRPLGVVLGAAAIGVLGIADAVRLRDS